MTAKPPLDETELDELGIDSVLGICAEIMTWLIKKLSRYEQAGNSYTCRPWHLWVLQEVEFHVLHEKGDQANTKVV